jgi:hypothetical protein
MPTTIIAKKVRHARAIERDQIRVARRPAVRLHPVLHAALRDLADIEGYGLDRFVTVLVNEALERRLSGH